VACTQTAHLLRRGAHLLQSIREELAGSLEGGELIHRLLDAGPDLIQATHPRRELGSHAVEPADILPERACADCLLGDRVHFLRQLGDLLTNTADLRLHGGGALARGIEDGQPLLAVLYRVAEIGDPLADGVQPAVLQLESFAALPHLLAQVGERLAGRLLGVFDLLGGRL
jgi:hypothetical protein